MELTIKDIARICNGTIVCGEKETICKSFTKDTRVLKEGDTYVGIKGDNFDGNLFYKEAFRKGANAAILEKESFHGKIENEKPIILVENAILALKQMAEFKRDNSNAYFIGVTGSVGKTSTKDLIYCVVKEKFNTLKTAENYNNNIGLPLTLLRLNNESCAVIEMGMNKLGEIEYLSRITRPHIAVITNVGTSHIGELGSRANILQAKLEIKKGMEKNGILILNNDNDLLHQYYEENKENTITVGIENKSDFQAVNIIEKENFTTFDILYQNKSCTVTCPVPGICFIYNCLIAFAIGILFNMKEEEIKKGIENLKLTKNRMEILTIKDEITVINDAYNASLDSMNASLEILKNQQANKKIAVLGSMLELGEYSKELHHKVGKSVVENKIDYLITVGEDAKNIAYAAKNLGMSKNNIFIFDNNQDALEKLKEIKNPKDAILIKASNGLHFSEIVDGIRKN